MSHRLYLRLLPSLMLMLLLNGCIRGLFEGAKTRTIPNVTKIAASNENIKQQPVEARRSHPDPKTSEQLATAPLSDVTNPPPPTKAEQKLPPQEIASSFSPPSQPAQATSIPRSENPPPAAVYRDMLLTEDIAWKGEALVEGWVTVAPQATLTVIPGTVVRFRKNGSGVQGGLLVQGRIIVKGTEASPVIFTANFTEPEAGDWQGIVLLSSEKKNLMEHVRISGAETGLDASFSTVTVVSSFFTRCRTGLRLQDTLVTLTGGKISDCGLGLALYDSEVELRDAAIGGNRLGGVVVRTSLSLAGGAFDGNIGEALTVDNSRVRIVGAGFTSNGSGVRLTACDGVVTGCRLKGNAGYGLSLARSRVRVNNNEITGNGSFGLMVEDGQGAAWGNRFVGNGKYDVYNAGSEEFRAMSNWWDRPADSIQSRIYDRQTNAERGRVYFLPILQARPLPLP
ncbi:MAG: right-handed parallel beta-helix repeat-containing protein [Geobacteraceae bacterium]